MFVSRLGGGGGEGEWFDEDPRARPREGQQHPDPDPCRDQRRATIADEGQRHPLGGQEAHRNPHVDHRLHAEAGGDAERDQATEGVPGAQGDRAARHHEGDTFQTRCHHTAILLHEQQADHFVDQTTQGLDELGDHDGCTFRAFDRGSPHRRPRVSGVRVPLRSHARLRTLGAGSDPDVEPGEIREPMVATPGAPRVPGASAPRPPCPPTIPN